MTWFKVDDGFYDHPKVADLPDSAIALWTRAGSWCAKHLTDGKVPRRAIRRFCDDPDEAAKALVDAGMWTTTAEGYLFHDWDIYQPSRDETEQKRADHARRQAEYRERKRLEREQARRAADAKQQAHVTPPATVTRQDGDASRDMNGDASRDASVTDTVMPARPVPTRPVPTVVPKGTTTGQELKPLPPAARAAHIEPDAALIPGTDLIPAQAVRTDSGRGTRLPADWLPSEKLREWARTDLPGYNTRAEHPNFVDYWVAKSGRDATKRDWDATWRKWMREAARRSGWKPNTPTTTDDGRQIHRRTGEHLDHLSRYGDLDA